MSSFEQRVRSALHDAAERLPEEGVLVATAPRGSRRTKVGVLGAFAAVVAMLPIALLLTSDPPQAPTTVRAGLEVRFDPSRADLLEVSEYQRAILEDGVITVEEMRQAMTDHVWCIRESGFGGTEGWMELDGSTALYFPEGVEEGTAEDLLDRAVFDCGSAYLDPVRGFYAELYRTERYLGPLLPALADEDLVSCLAAKGAHVTRAPGGSQEWRLTVELERGQRTSEAAWDILELCEPELRRASIVPFMVPPSPNGD